MKRYKTEAHHLWAAKDAAGELILVGPRSRAYLWFSTDGGKTVGILGKKGLDSLARALREKP